MTTLLGQQDPRAPVRYHAGELEVFADPDCALNLGNEDFAAWTGTLLYHGERGADAVRRMAGDLRSGRLDENALCGPFACFLRIDARACLLSDWLGGIRLFHSEAGDVWSTSFLAACNAHGGRQINPAGAWEYILHGACFGEDTPVRGLRRLPPDNIYYLDDPQALPRPRVREAGPPPGNLTQAARQCLDRLEPVFDAIARPPGDRVWILPCPGAMTRD